MTSRSSTLRTHVDRAIPPLYEDLFAVLDLLLVAGSDRGPGRGEDLSDLLAARLRALDTAAPVDVADVGWRAR